MNKIQIKTEPPQPHQKAILWTFSCKKWIDSTNARKSSIKIFLNKSTLSNWEKIKNIEPKSEGV